MSRRLQGPRVHVRLEGEVPDRRVHKVREAREGAAATDEELRPPGLPREVGEEERE